MPDRFWSDETLLGYLLEALEPNEMQQVENALHEDAFLLERLHELRSMMLPWTDKAEEVQHPEGLVDRVLDSVYSDSALNDGSSGERKSDSPNGRQPHSKFSFSVESPESPRSRRWIDISMAIAATVVFLCILTPAVVRTQETSRAMQCASQLRSLGEMIREYALHRSDAQIPSVAAEGPLSFAGVYAFHLTEAGLLDDRRIIWCPSQSMMESPTFVQFVNQKYPTTNELEQLPPTQLNVWQHIAGGTYSYNLGTLVGDRLSSPKLNEGNGMAILADAPNNIDPDNAFAIHQDNGTNILFQDGRVELVRLDRSYDPADHPYFNRRGQNRAGLDRLDSSLGTSFQKP